MINPKNGEYSPTPIYNRKMVRKALRESVIKRDGYHNVSSTMARYFKIYNDKIHNRKEN